MDTISTVIIACGTIFLIFFMLLAYCAGKKIREIERQRYRNVEEYHSIL